MKASYNLETGVFVRMAFIKVNGVKGHRSGKVKGNWSSLMAMFTRASGSIIPSKEREG